MDPNLVQATLSGYFASSHNRDRHPLHLEREMVVYKSADRGSHRSWMTAMRRWTGAGFILLGERIGQKPGPEPADTAVTS
jgi:hypothetical protein